MSHICVTKNSSHFHSDAYMRGKSLYFSYKPRGRPTKQCQAKMSFNSSLTIFSTHLNLSPMTLFIGFIYVRRAFARQAASSSETLAEWLHISGDCISQAQLLILNTTSLPARYIYIQPAFIWLSLTYNCNPELYGNKRQVTKHNTTYQCTIINYNQMELL